MKGLNVRKLAAVAVGGALVGSALAPLAAAITLDRSDVVNVSSGQPVLSVVVGSKGAGVSDFVWAGNIAAKVAQLATVETAVSGGEGSCTVSDLSVDLTSGGEVSYSEEYSYTYQGTSYPLASMDNAASLEFRKEAGSGQLPFLSNTTKSYRYNGSTYEIVVKETIGIEADARFDTHQDVKDLVVYMKNEGDFNYVLNLGEGIPGWATTAGGTAFTDGDNDNVVIPFLGDEYTVQECDVVAATKQIKLIKESAKTNYNEGDEITGLTGKSIYAGEEMSVKVAAITQSSGTASYEARFELYDSNGNLVDHQTLAQGVYLNENFYDSSGNYALETVVYVSTVRVEPTTSSGVVTVIVGKDVVTLADGKQYPYDSTDTDVGDDYWKASFDVNSASNTSPAVATVEKITIKNAAKKWNKDDPLWSADSSLTQAGKDAADAGGNVAGFLEGESSSTLGYEFVKLQFDGFKVDQSLTTVKVGNGQVVYKDSEKIQRTVPFYIALDNTSTESTFSVSGQTFYYRCSADDVNLLIWDQNYLNGALVDVNLGLAVGGAAGGLDIACDNNAIIDVNGTDKDDACDLNGVQYDVQGLATNAAQKGAVYLVADGNCEFSLQPFATVDYLQIGGAENYTTMGTSTGSGNITAKTVFYDDDNVSRTPLDIPVYVKNDTLNDTYRYRMYVERTSSADGDIYLLLDSGTDFSSEFSSFDGPTFLGTEDCEVANLGGCVTAKPYYWPDTTDFGNETGDNSYITAHFKVDVNTSDDVNVYIDTATDDLVTLPNDQLSAYNSDVNFPSAGVSLNVRTDASNYYQSMWVDYGSKVELTDDKETVTVTIPENQIYLKLVLMGEGATQVVSGGDTVEGVEEGDTVTLGSSDITVSAINYAAGACTVEDETYQKLVSVGQLVYSDTPAPAGNHIIVGGYLVNRLAENVTLADGSSMQEALTASGDTVVELLDGGDIVVAGYTANDTASAARELIDALDALMA